MANFAETLKEVLQTHRKNIGDLISQDLTVLLLAHVLLENPALEAEINSIFANIYQDISKKIESLLRDFAHKRNHTFSQEEEKELKTEIQRFVWEIIQDRQQLVFDKMDWLSKINRNN